MAVQNAPRASSVYSRATTGQQNFPAPERDGDDASLNEHRMDWPDGVPGAYGYLEQGEKDDEGTTAVGSVSISPTFTSHEVGAVEDAEDVHDAASTSSQETTIRPLQPVNAYMRICSLSQLVSFFKARGRDGARNQRKDRDAAPQPASAGRKRAYTLLPPVRSRHNSVTPRKAENDDAHQNPQEEAKSRLRRRAISSISNVFRRRNSTSEPPWFPGAPWAPELPVSDEGEFMREAFQLVSHHYAHLAAKQGDLSERGVEVGMFRAFHRASREVPDSWLAPEIPERRAGSGRAVALELDDGRVIGLNYQWNPRSMDTMPLSCGSDRQAGWDSKSRAMADAEKE
ncbi:Hypothetical predicted protein [Lecanosticta acicola]|uniref:Uncharacterized protein n=1 Tax=Lecanosticta acicola TaxID=111012 RepID=A0AAI8YT76_9PEZI|nr:Hypothetical predicted protein [Lecanosticta acicola]